MRTAVALVLSLLSVTSCDNPRDNYLGAFTKAQGGSGAGGQGGGCVAASCPDHVFTHPSAPSDAPDIFSRSATEPKGSAAQREPELIYPSSETRFPAGLRRVRFEWTSAGNSLFELGFQGSRGTMHVYTAETAFVTAAVESEALREVAERGEPIRVSLRALDPSAPSQSFAAAPSSISLGSALPNADIYYWSSTAHGVLRTRLENALPQRLAIGGAEKCNGCHALSRDGTRIALDAGDGHLKLADIASLLVQPESVDSVVAAPEPTPMPMPGKMDKITADTPALWAAFSPDGAWVLAAQNGALSLVDASTGMPMGPNPIALPAKSTATHPDWSPSGDRIAFTLADKGKGRAIEHGAIASATFDGKRFGPVEVWVPNAGGDDNKLFPSFSPDGQYLAFVSARGKSDNAASASIKLLRLTDQKQFDLPRLNTLVNNGVANDLGNTMPTWARSPDSGELWLSFSSLRAYASVRPADAKLDQLWIAAVDSRLDDPALPAFWATFQDLAHANHRAFWSSTQSVDACGCQELCGDGIDNDCDGNVDEGDCHVCIEREICDDGVDNDCDCVIDDCSVEACTDSVDNDGDGFIDAADLLCMKPAP